jgi:hypothetical protein
MMTKEEIDQLALDLPRMTMHGPIPPSTTHAFAARIVELIVELQDERKAFAEYVAKNQSR